MGLILSKIYEKPSTRDTLEKIEQELQNIEERRYDKIKREQFMVQILSFIPITILIANLCILLYPSNSSWRDKLVLSIPIAILNLTFWVCRKIVQWYSRWSLDNEEARLRKLQKQKKKILELVCETESYRVATELLEKYDPKQLRRREKLTERPSSPQNVTLSKFTASPIRSPQQQQMRDQSQLQHQPSNPHLLAGNSSFLNQSMTVPLQPLLPTMTASVPPTPASKQATTKSQLNATSTNLHNTTVNTVAASSVQGRPVRPIINKDRSFFEKVVDWVVADGPDNRFALICRFCYGHNGMSLAEEYETINFRCCFCYNLNTATNKRTQVHDQLQPDREENGVKSTQKTESDDKKADKEATPDANIAEEDIAPPAAGVKKSERSKSDSSKTITGHKPPDLIEDEDSKTSCDKTEPSESTQSTK